MVKTDSPSSSIVSGGAPAAPKNRNFHPRWHSGFRSSHFAPAFFFLDRSHRRALQTLYAFFRVLDDAVDAPREDPRPILAAWRTALTEHRAGAVQSWGQEALAEDLLAVIRSFGVPEFALLDFIDKGVTEDIIPHRYQTPMDTEAYCYGVAGTVGIACLPLFGVPWAEAKDFAVRLGIAVQWINLVRDIAVDARMGRIYLPRDHWEACGCEEADILQSRPTPALQRLLELEGSVARSHYRRAMELLPPVWKKALRPARIMGHIYLSLLDKITKRGYPVLTERVSLTFWEKGLATMKVFQEKRP